MPCYAIVPISGREAIQRNFIDLPKTANRYNGRRLTLNERFRIISRGYWLKCVDERAETPDMPRSIAQSSVEASPLSAHASPQKEEKRFVRVTSNSNLTRVGGGGKTRQPAKRQLVKPAGKTVEQALDELARRFNFSVSTTVEKENTSPKILGKMRTVAKSPLKRQN